MNSTNEIAKEIQRVSDFLEQPIEHIGVSIPPKIDDFQRHSSIFWNAYFPDESRTGGRISVFPEQDHRRMLVHNVAFQLLLKDRGDQGFIRSAMDLYELNPKSDFCKVAAEQLSWSELVAVLWKKLWNKE